MLAKAAYGHERPSSVTKIAPIEWPVPARLLPAARQTKTRRSALSVMTMTQIKRPSASYAMHNSTFLLQSAPPFARNVLHQDRELWRLA